MSVLHSIQIGQLVTEGDANSRDTTTRRWTTGFYKYPVAGPIRIDVLGVQGDQIGDRGNHGGVDKAVLCYAAGHYQSWAIEVPHLELSPGGFAENLTIDGWDERTVCLGDRFLIGETVLEVSQPRQPCWKIARRWGDKSLPKRVAQTGRTGWYVRVLRSGTCSPGDAVQRIKQPHPDWTIQRANDLMFGIVDDADAMATLAELPELARSWKDDLQPRRQED